VATRPPQQDRGGCAATSPSLRVAALSLSLSLCFDKKLSYLYICLGFSQNKQIYSIENIFSNVDPTRIHF
jgi:hypothetical protein